MERTSVNRPTLGSLIPIVTGLVAVVGLVAYAIMRYSYQRFYDQFGLTPDDVGPSSAAALTQSGARVATFVALFAILPLALALTASQVVAAALRSDFSRYSFPAGRRAVMWLHILADLALPIVVALAVYRLFTAATSGSRELKGLIVLGIAVFLLTSKQYASSLRQDLSASSAAPTKSGFAQRFLRATSQLPRTAWIVAAVLIVGSALVLGGSLPRDARRTADCVIDRRQPVRWVHTHRTFLWIGSLSHMAVLQARADPAQMFSAGMLSPKGLPRRTSNAGSSLVYLGNSGGRDFVYDTEQGQTLQIPDSSVVIATKPGPHCHWWEHR